MYKLLHTFIKLNKKIIMLLDEIIIIEDHKLITCKICNLIKYPVSLKTSNEKFTCRDPSIDGRIALVKLKRSWFFKFLRSSGSVQLCSSHIILQQEYHIIKCNPNYYIIKIAGKTNVYINQYIIGEKKWTRDVTIYIILNIILLEYQYFLFNINIL